MNSGKQPKRNYFVENNIFFLAFKGIVLILPVLRQDRSVFSFCFLLDETIVGQLLHGETG